MNSRTSTGNVKKKPNSKNSKKNISSSTSTTLKKKKNTVNNTQSKRTTKKDIQKKQTNTNKDKSKNVANKQNLRKKVTSTKQDVPKTKRKVKREIAEEDLFEGVDFINVEGFEEYNEANPNITKKKKINSNDNIRKLEIEEEEKDDRLISPLTIITISFILALLIAGGYLMLNLEYFNLSNIKVKGNTKYTSDVIIKNTSLNVGNNVFKEMFSRDYNKSEIPYVSNLKYNYIFPNEIEIEVEERYPEYIAKDKSSDKYYMLDNQGYILEECTMETKGDTLLIEGFSFENEIDYGSQINEVYLRKLLKYKEIKQLLKDADISTNITKVNFNASLTTITIDGKLNVVFSNESNLRYRVSFLKSIIKQNGSIEEGTIDMSLENPVYSKYD